MIFWIELLFPKTPLKNSEVFIAAGMHNLSDCFLKDGAKVLAKTISDFESCEISKLKSIYKKGSLTEASNHWPITLLGLTSKVIEKVIQDQTSASVNSRLCYTVINLVSAKIIPLTAGSF